MLLKFGGPSQNGQVTKFDEMFKYRICKNLSEKVFPQIFDEYEIFVSYSVDWFALVSFIMVMPPM